MVPCCPQPAFVVDVDFIISSHRPYDVKSSCEILSCLVWDKGPVNVNASSLLSSTYGPRRGYLAIKFLSLMPHHIVFLKPPGSLWYPCQHKGPNIFVSSSLSLSSVHMSPNSTSKSHVIQKSLAPPRRPSRSTSVTLEMQSSYISKHLLESGAYTAITSVVPKRIAVHLSSNFHDLRIVLQLFWNQQCCETRSLLP